MQISARNSPMAGKTRHQKNFIAVIYLLFSRDVASHRQLAISHMSMPPLGLLIQLLQQTAPTPTVGFGAIMRTNFAIVAAHARQVFWLRGKKIGRRSPLFL